MQTAREQTQASVANDVPLECSETITPVGGVRGRSLSWGKGSAAIEKM